MTADTVYLHLKCQKMWIYDNKLQRKTCESVGREVTGCSENCVKKELHNSYYSKNII